MSRQSEEASIELPLIAPFLTGRSVVVARSAADMATRRLMDICLAARPAAPAASKVVRLRIILAAGVSLV